MIRKLSLIALILIFGVSSAIAAEKYTLDAAHAHVGFKVSHMVLAKVKGTFHDVAGTLMYDENDPTKSTVEVLIDVSSIDTDNKDRDDHLRGPDFFDAATHPNIIFKSKEIRKTDDGYVAVGDFTIKDQARTLELPFVITGQITDPWGNERIGVEAETEIDRTNYGITWNKTLDKGGLVVGNDVEIEISVEFVKETEEP